MGSTKFQQTIEQASVRSTPQRLAPVVFVVDATPGDVVANAALA